MAITKTPFPHAPFSFGLDRPVTGRVFYVDSGATIASDGNLGDSPERPLATIEGAFNHGDITASNGDIIYVMAGHSETITAAAGIAADIAGVTVVGLGVGRNKPTINFTTATTADLDIDAANITFENIFFDLTGVDAVVAAIDVNAADFTLKDCEILMADGNGQAVVAVLGATAADRMKVVDCTFRAPNAGADCAIRITGTADGNEVIGCDIYGDFADACIHNPTSNVATNVRIEKNYLQNDQTGDHAIEFVSAVTGLIADNRLVTDAIATGADLGSCVASDNVFFDSSDTDATATPYPETVTTGGHALFALESVIGGVEDTTTDSLHGKIGTDTEMADTSLFDMHGVPAQDATTDVNMRDVVGKKDDTASIIEATTDSLMSYVKGLMTSTVRTLVKTNGAVLTGDDPLFTIAGGSIHVISIVGTVKTVIGGASNLHLNCAVTTPSADVSLSTDVAIGSDGEGAVYTFLGPTGILTPTDAGLVLMDYGSTTLTPTQWIVPIGTIEASGSAAQTGVISWVLTYYANSAATVTVAA